MGDSSGWDQRESDGTGEKCTGAEYFSSGWKGDWIGFYDREWGLGQELSFVGFERFELPSDAPGGST